MPFQASLGFAGKPSATRVMRRRAEVWFDGVHSAANAPAVRGPDIGSQAPTGTSRMRPLPGLLSVEEGWEFTLLQNFSA
jgi:hypothetical protein